MSSFREQLEADIHNVFLNTAEFGQTISINGQTMKAVVEAFEVQADQSDAERIGLSMEGLLLHVAESDAPGEFRYGRTIEFNGEKWFVLDASRDECLRTIRIYRELS